MTRSLTLMALILALCAASCGSNPPKTDEQPVENVPAATNDEATEPPADAAAEEGEGEMLPPPPNVDAPPPNAESSPSGLAWIVVQPGEGDESPTLESTIKVHYTGWTTDGKMFDSSVVRNEPIEFPLAALIEGWKEGIPMMKRGEKRRFWIPGELAYAKSPRPDAPKGMLVFDIELLDFH